MLERIHGSIKVPPKVARRDEQIEYLRAEAKRLRAALVTREREIVRLRAELAEINKEKTSERAL
jgi:predicted RNase H-like nuclease (RuvC/YqgF family)